MRRKLKRAVLKKFSEGISVLCPGFELFMKKNNLLYWNLKIGEEFLFSIMIWPNRRHDVFTIDLKWSDDEINWFSSPRHLESWRRRGRGGLGYLTMRKPGFVPNFDLDPELTAARRDDVLEEFAKWPAPTDVDIALARVEPLVVDALDKIKRYAMPFFRKVAETHGLIWPDDLAELYSKPLTLPSR